MMNHVTRKCTKLLIAAMSVVSTATMLTLTAFADGGTTNSGNGGSATGNVWSDLLVSVLPLAIAILLMYLILFRPQKKREQEAQKMRENVRIGDEICTAGGLIGGVIMCKLTKGKVNPLIGSAGVSAVPMAARVANVEGQKANPANFLLMHAMGPNVAGVIGSAIAAGFLLSVFG